MCWSWPVSLAFFLFEVTCMVYLIKRDNFLDKLWAIGIAPIALQEGMQCLLWAFAIDDDTTSDNCSELNKVLSFIIMFTIWTIPSYYAWLPAYQSYNSYIKTHHDDDECNWKLINLALRVHFWVQVLVYIWNAVDTIYYVTAGDDEYCTYVGPNGHQVWALADIVGRDSITINILALFYLLSAIAAGFLFRPGFCVLLAGGYCVISAVTMRIFLPTEWGSLWCWACSFLALYFVATDKIAEYVVSEVLPKFDYENNPDVKRPWWFVWLFDGTHFFFTTQGSSLRKSTMRNMQPHELKDIKMELNIVENENVSSPSKSATVDNKNVVKRVPSK